MRARASHRPFPFGLNILMPPAQYPSFILFPTGAFGLLSASFLGFTRPTVVKVRVNPGGGLISGFVAAVSPFCGGAMAAGCPADSPHDRLRWLKS